MSFVGNFAKTLARRGNTMMVPRGNTMMVPRLGARQGARRSVRTVPRLGTEAEMEAEAIAQIRARIAYQKELMADNPHKSHAEEWKELWTWINISIFVCGPVVVLALLKDFIFEVHHHRPHDGLPEYMGIRNKEFPWKCGNCDFFDLDCWKQCKANK